MSEVDQVELLTCDIYMCFLFSAVRFGIYFRNFPKKYQTLQKKSPFRCGSTRFNAIFLHHLQSMILPDWLSKISFYGLVFLKVKKIFFEHRKKL